MSASATGGSSRDRGRSPYDGARVEELEEPLLPRWFVLLAVALVPVAIGVAVWAFVVFGPEEVPVSERRPPPSDDGTLTTDVGQYNVGDSDAEPIPLADCPQWRGIRAGGSEADRGRIDTALSALCEERLPQDVARGVQALARAQGVIRFAQFQATGVDSTLDLAADPPRILLNARFARAETEPLWIAPLVAHDTTYLTEPVGPAASALAAREAEATMCARLLGDEEDPEPSRACDDARALLELLDPLRALEAAGFS